MQEDKWMEPVTDLSKCATCSFYFGKKYGCLRFRITRESCTRNRLWKSNEEGS